MAAVGAFSTASSVGTLAVFLGDRLAVGLRLQRGRTGDDFNQLLGDDRLPGSVEGQRQLVNHLSRILGRAVHGGHPRALFAARILLHCIVNEAGQ